MRKRIRVALCAILFSLATISLALGAAFVGPVYDSPNMDYQPSIIRVQPSGQLMIVFERQVTQSNYDQYVTTSSDGGTTWTTPQAILSSASNERHPALIQLGPSSLALFYLSNETGGYRIHRATSADGSTWTPQGALNLGWATGGDLNPAVIREADGTLTMTYQRSGVSYIARSSDGGVTWDTLRTQVSTAGGALPRIARRESDGTYLVTYQVNPGTNVLQMYAKVSNDPYTWSGAEIPFSIDANSHDSQPIVLEDGTFVTFYIQQTASAPFNIYYRISQDGINWGPKVRVTSDRKYYNLQPHPLLQGTPGHVMLVWSHQESATAYQDHDIWINTDLTLSLSTSLLPLVQTGN
ncbi:MAG TPA: sialidase family protein [Herpetosiphonaceae bacterium]